MQFGCLFVLRGQFLSTVVCMIVLQIMVWFWIHFEQIFHTSPAACSHLIGSHTRICFSSSNHNDSFFSFTQSMPVGMLQSCIPTFPFHSSTYIHTPTTVSPGGHRSSVGGEHHYGPILTGATPPSHSWLSSNHIYASKSSNTQRASTCRSHSCRPMIFAGFDIKAYSPKLLSNNERGKTDIVVKWWPSFLHLRWSASTLKFPIFHMKKSMYKEQQQILIRLRCCSSSEKKVIWGDSNEPMLIQTTVPTSEKILSISLIQSTKLLQKNYLG